MLATLIRAFFDVRAAREDNVALAKENRHLESVIVDLEDVIRDLRAELDATESLLAVLEVPTTPHLFRDPVTPPTEDDRR